MNLAYSPDERLLYVRLRPGEVAETIEVGADVYADLDAAGEPLGIEALNAAEFFTVLADNADPTDGMIVVDLPDGLVRLLQAARQVPLSSSCTRRRDNHQADVASCKIAGVQSG